MRGLKRDRTARVVIRGHAFIQNLRRGHYELGVDAPPGLSIAGEFDGLAPVIWAARLTKAGQLVPDDRSMQQRPHAPFWQSPRRPTSSRSWWEGQISPGLASSRPRI